MVFMTDIRILLNVGLGAHLVVVVVWTDPNLESLILEIK